MTCCQDPLSHKRALTYFCSLSCFPTIVRMGLSYPESRSKIGAEINQKSFHSCGTVHSFAISVFFLLVL